METVRDRKEDQDRTMMTTSLLQQIRNPSVFCGESGQDPNKWLREYERVAKYNKWDDLVCLANVYFFLDGTARQWFENNEDQLTSWDKLKEELRKIFGDNEQSKKKAEVELKSRAQKSGESTQSYIQSVLGLCQEVKPDMPEDEKVSHLMKGVAEDIYQALLTKELKTSDDFIKWCQYIEEMKQKRVGRKKFDRLPNVVPMASLTEDTDLSSLIRRIVREEVRCFIGNHPDEPESQLQSIEAIVKEQVQEVLSPLTKSRNDWTEVQRPPRRQTFYSDVVRDQRPSAEPQRRKTDLWRTNDNRPVCFHCGRPGHVVRYCRERRAIFDAYRGDRRNAAPSTEVGDTADYSRASRRSASPSPSRGRSPTRRYRSPSPFQRSSASPSRRNEEN